MEILIIQSPYAQWPSSVPCVVLPATSQLVPDCPDVLNSVMISAAHSNISLVNGYYKAKELSLVGFLFGSLPGLLS